VIEPPFSTERIEVMIERRVREAEETAKAKFLSLEKALDLQAKEYTRRLDLLNGEHATLAQMKNDFVLRVIYDKDMDRLRLQDETARKAAEEARVRQDVAMATSRRNTLTLWVAIGLALVGWAITLVPQFYHHS
jgi:hypothetical protein